MSNLDDSQRPFEQQNAMAFYESFAHDTMVHTRIWWQSINNGWRWTTFNCSPVYHAKRTKANAIQNQRKCLFLLHFFIFRSFSLLQNHSFDCNRKRQSVCMNVYGYIHVCTGICVCPRVIYSAKMSRSRVPVNVKMDSWLTMNYDEEEKENIHPSMHWFEMSFSFISFLVWNGNGIISSLNIRCNQIWK